MICGPFILDWLQGMSGDRFKVALYTSAAKLDKTTAVYTPKNEVTGLGYNPGGIALSGFEVVVALGYVGIKFDEPVWKMGTFTARYALIYNASRGNRAVQVIDFGADKSSENGKFSFYPEDGGAFLRIAV